MAGTHDLALFALTALVLNMTPGVDLMFTLTRTLQQGVRGGMAAALGIASGCIVHTLAAAFGVAALLAASAAAFALLKASGAIYLAWLAFGMLREATRATPSSGPATSAPASSAAALPASACATADASAAKDAREPMSGTTAWSPRTDGVARPAVVAPAAADLRRTYRQALVTNALNPKVAIFFLALLPQFIDAGAPHKTIAFLFLGAWFVVQGFAFLAVFALAVAPLRGWRPSDLWRRSLLAGGGLLFAALAARLAIAERS